MNAFKLFKQKLGDNFSRKFLSSPHTYRLAKGVFLRRNNFRWEATRQMTAMALEQAAEAYQKKSKVAWTTAFFPGEIVHAFGLVPFAPEAASVMAANLGLAPQLLREADRLGLGSDGCSFHRCAAAGTHNDYFPVPDILLASSHLCDGAPQLFKYMAQIYKKPFFLLDVPGEWSEGAERYVARQYKELVELLEKETGKKLTPQIIEETFTYSNKAREQLQRVNNLRKNPPARISGPDALAFVYLMFLGQGHKETPAIYTALADELDAKVKNDQGKRDEHFRLIWLHLKPYYENNLLEYLEGELQAAVAFEEMNYAYWPPLDPERPFLSMARKALSHPSLGPVDKRLQLVLKLVKDYRADAVVHFSHWGCRQAVGSTVYLKDQLRRRGIPFLSLDGDCIDPQSFPVGQARTRVESFVEMLSEQAELSH